MTSPDMNRCETYTNDELLDYLEAVMDPEEKDRMKQHIISCKDCTRALQELDSIRSGVEHWQEETESVTFPDGAEEDLFARIEQNQSLQSTRRQETAFDSPAPANESKSSSGTFLSGIKPTYIVPAGIAALVLIGVLLQPYLFQSEPSMEESANLETPSSTDSKTGSGVNPSESRPMGETSRDSPKETPQKRAETSENSKKQTDEKERDTVGRKESTNRSEEDHDRSRSREIKKESTPENTQEENNKPEENGTNSLRNRKDKANRKETPEKDRPSETSGESVKKEEENKDTDKDPKKQAGDGEAPNKRVAKENDKHPAATGKPDQKPEPVTVGDVNGDGVINVTDSMLITRAVENNSVTEQDRKIMDANGDGTVTLSDANYIMSVFVENGNQRSISGNKSSSDK